MELLAAPLTDPLAAQADKVCGLDILRRRTTEWRAAKGAKVVFTNGCYDLIHRGHVTLLAGAKGRGRPPGGRPEFRPIRSSIEG